MKERIRRLAARARRMNAPRGDTKACTQCKTVNEPWRTTRIGCGGKFE